MFDESVDPDTILSFDPAELQKYFTLDPIDPAELQKFFSLDPLPPGELSEQERFFKEARELAIKEGLYNIPARTVTSKIPKIKKQVSVPEKIKTIVKEVTAKIANINFKVPIDLLINVDEPALWNYATDFLSRVLGSDIIDNLNRCGGLGEPCDFKKLKRTFTKYFSIIIRKLKEIKDFLGNPGNFFDNALSVVQQLLTLFLLFFKIKEIKDPVLLQTNYSLGDDKNFKAKAKKLEDAVHNIFYNLVIKHFLPGWGELKLRELTDAFIANRKDFIPNVLSLWLRLPPLQIVPKLPHLIFSKNLPNYPLNKKERVEIINKMIALNIPVNNRNLVTFLNKNQESDSNHCIAMWRPQQKIGEIRETIKRCELKNVFVKMEKERYRPELNGGIDRFGEIIDFGEIKEYFTFCTKHIKKIFGIHFIKNNDQKTFTATAARKFETNEAVCLDTHMEIGSLLQPSADLNNLIYDDGDPLQLKASRPIEMGEALYKPLSSFGTALPAAPQLLNGYQYNAIQNTILDAQNRRNQLLAARLNAPSAPDI